MPSLLHRGDSQLDSVRLDHQHARKPAGYTCVRDTRIHSQAGLQGVRLGNFLIKRVVKATLGPASPNPLIAVAVVTPHCLVQELQREFSGLQYFVTLSPIPGAPFPTWLFPPAHTTVRTSVARVCVYVHMHRLLQVAIDPRRVRAPALA